MNTQRAIEISESPVMANVTFNGSRVYIQHVNDSQETAKVYHLDDPENEQDIDLDNLIENS